MSEQRTSYDATGTALLEGWRDEERGVPVSALLVWLPLDPARVAAQLAAAANAQELDALIALLLAARASAEVEGEGPHHETP